MSAVPPNLPPGPVVSGGHRSGHVVRRIPAGRVEIIPPSRPGPTLEPARYRRLDAPSPLHAAIAAYDRAQTLGPATLRLVDRRV